MKRQQILFLVALLLCFAFGSYVWKIRNTGSQFWRKHHDEEFSVADMDFTVHVGNYLVTRDEIDWEYQFYMQQVMAPESGSLAEAAPLDASNPTPPVVSSKVNLELYNKILADLIERKLLYQHIASDKRFGLKDPSRYTRCIEDWKNTSERMPGVFKADSDRERLKAMLCEKDVLLQYIQERIVGSIQFTEDELKDYFNSHREDFTDPPRAIVRQIVLGTESEAKRVNGLVNSGNFQNLARDLSISPEAKDGGLIGPFAKGDMPSFFDVAFEMKPGAIQGVLKSTYGFHILMLEKKLPRSELAFEAARGRVIETLTQKRRDEEYKKWVESALNSVPIKSSRPF